uniref:Uncharacterized protein n=1 Tax=Arion vulgaris TaxID=1028688 RepID=A0A0B7AUS6_9EUPU
MPAVIVRNSATICMSQISDPKKQQVHSIKQATTLNTLTLQDKFLTLPNTLKVTY